MTEADLSDLDEIVQIHEVGAPDRMDESTAPATSEDDEDSDDSNYSNNNTNSNMSVMTNGSGGRRHYGGRWSSASSSSNVKGEEKRSHHNVLERKRRDLLKDSFARLRDSVPTTQPKERVSRAEILRHAADFIASTVHKNAAVRAELDELIRKNRELDEKRKKELTGDGDTTAPTQTGSTSESNNIVPDGIQVSAPSTTKPESEIKQEF